VFGEFLNVAFAIYLSTSNLQSEIPHVVVTPPTITLFLLLLHNCNFATVMNHNVHIEYAGYLIGDPCERGGQ
ncbi:hypothetical protein H671_7g17857, partial [Cricetulus griseus]